MVAVMMIVMVLMMLVVGSDKKVFFEGFQRTLLW